MLAESVSCLLRYTLVGGLYADNAILIARIIENRLIITTTFESYSHLYPTKHGEVADRLESFA